MGPHRRKEYLARQTIVQMHFAGSPSPKEIVGLTGGDQLESQLHDPFVELAVGRGAKHAAV